MYLLLSTNHSSETAVSSGAVLRALNKKDGPERISRSSYGFLCTEEHEPDVFPAHRGIRPFSEPLDGRKYLKYTIFWLIHKVGILVYVKLLFFKLLLIISLGRRDPYRARVSYTSLLYF
jgi:hypothetical protein